MGKYQMKSWNDLKLVVQAAVDASLNNEVSKEVVDKLKDSARSEIYDAYVPHGEPHYHRRESYTDDDAYLVHNEGRGEIFIEPHVEFNPGYGTSNSGYGLTQLIEQGNGAGGYRYEYECAHGLSWQYKQPRPFIHEAAEALESSSAHVVALADGLTKYNIVVTFK